MQHALEGWDIVHGADAQWMPWGGNGGPGRAKVLGSGDGYVLVLVEAAAGYVGDPHEHTNAELSYLRERDRRAPRGLHAGGRRLRRRGGLHAHRLPCHQRRHLRARLQALTPSSETVIRPPTPPAALMEPPPAALSHPLRTLENMSTTGESLRLKVFGIMRVSATKALRELRVEELTAPGADRLLDDVLAIEKAMAGLKVLLAGRATEGQGSRFAADRLARRSGTSQRQAADLLAASNRVTDQPKVEAALRDGGLSEEQATLIVDAAAANPGATDALLDTAKTEPLHGLKDRCGRAKAAADPDEDATHARIHAHRSFRHGRDSEGAFTASVRGTARGRGPVPGLPPTVPGRHVRSQPQGR